MNVTSSMVKNLLDYAASRIAEGMGLEALKTFNADDPELIRAYNIGYLPSGFKSILDEQSREWLASRRFENALIIPAFDEFGVPVDLLAIRPRSKDKTYVNLADDICGLIAPRITTAFETLIVTDSFRCAASVFRSGQKHVLFLRGVEDLKKNVLRLRTSGVSSARVLFRRASEEATDALITAGIAAQREKFPKKCDSVFMQTLGTNTPHIKTEITPVGDGSALRFQRYDKKTSQAYFSTVEATYCVTLGAPGETNFDIQLERAGQIHRDRFDLDVEAQRKRFASCAALRTAMPSSVIESQLVDLLNGIKNMVLEETAAPVSACSSFIAEDEKAMALSELARTDLLDRVVSDFEIFGWIGDASTKRLLYLTAISRKLERPLSAVLSSGSDIDMVFALNSIAAFTPPEDLIHCSRLTHSALYYQQQDALRHKLLILDDASLVTPEVKTTLRILQVRGAVSQSHVLRDPTTGVGTTYFHEAQGPLAIMTAAAKGLKTRILDQCLEISLDESMEQTDRILALQRHLRCDPEYQGIGGRKLSTIKKHVAMQRLLQCKRVLIPFADRIQFPSSSVRYRREQELFLCLIEAIALLHQYRRSVKKNASGNEFILAEIEDYEIACTLLTDLIGRARSELSSHAHSVLTLIVDAGLTSFELNDLTILRPDWTRYKFRAGINELLKLEVLTSASAGRGKVRQYSLQTEAAASLKSPTISLLSGNEINNPAKVGEDGFANFTSTAATG